MLITSRNKLKLGKKVNLTLNGKTRETHIMKNESTIFKDNRIAMKNLVNKLGDCTRFEPKTGDFRTPIWENVPNEKVINFIKKFKVHRELFSLDTNYLVKYINKKAEEGSAEKWTVALISLRSDQNWPSVQFGKYRIVPPSRTNNGDEMDLRFGNSRIIGGIKEELIDMSKTDLEKIEEEIRKNPKKSKIILAKKIRARRKSNLLLLYLINVRMTDDRKINNVPGYGISFAKDGKDTIVEYMVNKTYLETYLEEQE